jgi:hypothetical protein
VVARVLRSVAKYCENDRHTHEPSTDAVHDRPAETGNWKADGIPFACRRDMSADRGEWHALVRHLSHARRACAAEDYVHALAEVDAAMALDGDFLAAQALRDDIVERMSAVAVERPAAAHRIRAEDSTTAADSTPQPTTATGQAIQSRRAATVWPIMALAALIVIVGLAASFFHAESAATRHPRSPGVVVSSPGPSPMRTGLPDPLIAMSVFAAPTSATSAPTTVARWTSPRLTQLDVRPHWRASAMHVNDAALVRDLEESVSELWIGKAMRESDAIFVGAIKDDEWTTLGASLKRRGVVWVIDPVRARTTAYEVLSAAAAAGFVPVKHLRYSAAYTATQFARRR